MSLSAERMDRKKEVIDICLKTFIKKGLLSTSMRDLSKAIKSSSSGILYYYFADKDEAVIACAEEAANRLELELLPYGLQELPNPDAIQKNLYDKADEMASTMKFFTQVCTTPKYQEIMRPVLNSLSEHYKVYAAKFAAKLGCSEEQVEPFFSMCITAITNYMIFDEDEIAKPQLKIIEDRVRELISSHNASVEGEPQK